MTSIRIALAISLLGGSLASAFEPENPVWLRLCDKRDQAGKVLAPGTRAWEDAPVRSDLLDSLRNRGWDIRVPLRWKNLVSAQPKSSQASLPACVELYGPVAKPVPAPSPAPAAGGAAARSVSVDPAYITLKRMHENLGVAAVQDTLLARGQSPGQGVRVAVIDDGFIRQHMTLIGANIVDGWDFVADDSTPWAEGPAPWAWAHGTATAAIVASQWSLILPGIAPAAQLLLYRTEDDTKEVYAEEDYLAAAIVRAVDSGAQVITTSVGYRDRFDNAPDHPYSSMDGRTLVASQTATWAARRDVVVLAAVGNEGLLDLEGNPTVISPADADSVLGVGAVSEAGDRCPFSNTGPTADGRIKPELVAFGCSIPAAQGESPIAYYDGAVGTSYSTPLVAGMAVLLRQLRPTWTAKQVRDSLIASGSRRASPDNLTGWGIPDLRRIASIVSKPVQVTTKLPKVWGGAGVMSIGAVSEDVEFTLRTFDGRIVVSSALKRNRSFQFAAPPPGIYVGTWKGDTIDGSRLIVVPSFAL